MTSTRRPEAGPTDSAAGFDSGLSEALVRTSRFFRKGEVSADLRSLHQIGGRDADSFYRDRWAHDKVVRSTHGVNCTGSCSWKVYVKDGIITWEAQQTDYPSTGPDRPEYEPRGCPRGAAFSWYTYSPTRVRYPYVRGSLLQMYREARQRLGDPVLAWADVVSDPVRARTYKSERGRGGLVRASWDEATEMIAAAHVHTIKEYGPDRIAGFSPIPAMSMVSHAAGARFMSLIGAPMLSFYDWYADLPVASPQVFALVALAAPPGKVGAVTGIVGAAGGLGGFAPPLVMGLIHGWTGNYRPGLWLLSATALIAVVYTAWGMRTVGRAVSST